MQWRCYYSCSMVPYLIFYIILIEVAQGIPLDRFVRHYETLSYDHQALHARARRSIKDDAAEVEFKFKSHQRDFHLKLHPDNSAFTADHVITDGRGRAISVDTSFLFDGNVVGVNDSTVHGAIKQGVFEGKIYLDNDTFIVESANKYFKGPKSFHSVIYSERNVLIPSIAGNISVPHEAHSGSCGLSDPVRDWMRSVQNSAEPAIDPAIPENEVWISPADKYSRARNVNSTRRKRDAPADTDKNRLCNLYIQTDKFLWDAVYEREKDDQRTREEILAIISSHIKAITRIYGNHKFGDIVGIQFAVQRTTINDSSSCASEDRNPFCQKYLDVSNLLNYNSMMDHSSFCLAFLFTYRDFSGGTLGLAWVASANGPSGGICENYKKYTETVGGKRVQTAKSLNTGVITFVNYGNRVPPTVSHLTLAHEIGHNFGAAHDPPNALCQPNGAAGNYIMYPSATNGDRPNNDKFSPCSIENMTAVLKAVLTQMNGKRNCFVPNDLAYCGNKIYEKGEDCDCGYNVDECKEKCCYPRQIEDQWVKERAKPCTLRYSPELARHYDCSPSQGPCCTNDCTFTAHGTEIPQQCREATECTEAAQCRPDNATCPAPVPKPDITPCDNNSKVCKGGECNASICLLFGMEQCFLTEDKVPRNREGKEAMCFVACQFKDRPESCQSTRDKSFPVRNAYNVTINGGIRLRPGAPCNNFRGYCDIFYRCRRVDGDGPLRRLTNNLFSQEALESAGAWVTTNWWAVMLMGIALIVVMGCFIKCCAVHTPSSNPKKRPARRLADDWHSISSTLRRTRRSRPDGVRHHRDRVPRHRDPRHGRGGNRRRSQPPAEASAPVDATTTSAAIPLVQVHEAPPPYSEVISETNHPPLPIPPNKNGGPPRGHRKNRKGAGPSSSAAVPPLSNAHRSSDQPSSSQVPPPLPGRNPHYVKKDQNGRKK
ncbi:disintegrin and metalloproteinase domain-containing protein 10-like [Paramacrobiotus metropolitanus]|uniref:disintegrin and metalloproteinase domain-containing protein 10-like n=1 Tax=Paramacrobiotus metropolitanus TaxID=2943436 RepID=UPI00244561DB|nr:disintegrin and metalloproteinase domain-containing protein 10-like [Paramacrobiotus metropolitanus]XP_055333790.1 disintegrin and metalloproteinase domain-containing protein 10-like [Paramacrobiotus metropolitanus]